MFNVVTKIFQHSALLCFTSPSHFLFFPHSPRITSRTGRDQDDFSSHPLSTCQLLQGRWRCPLLCVLLIHPPFSLPLSITPSSWDILVRTFWRILHLITISNFNCYIKLEVSPMSLKKNTTSNLVAPNILCCLWESSNRVQLPTYHSWKKISERVVLFTQMYCFERNPQGLLREEGNHLGKWIKL